MFYALNAIQTALLQKKKVSFKYRKKGFKDKVIEELPVREETPVQLTYIDDFYYLIVWNDKHQNFVNYRVDRMFRLEVSDADATVNEQIKQFDIDKYQERVFGMYSGEVVEVTLRVNERVMCSVYDRFGKNIILNNPSSDGSTADVHVSVMEAPTFYGWLATFGTDIELVAPKKTRQKYQEYLSGILQSYQSQKGTS